MLADFLRDYAPTSVPKALYMFIPGETPFSTTRSVATALVSYLVVIFGIQAFMKDSQPQKLNTLFRVHNVFLSSGSLLLLVLMLEEIIPIILKHGVFFALCDKSSWTPRMELYYLVNYFFKYIELIDTVFLALKKKPLAFLHVFHHSATALLCYSQLVGRTSMSWIVITLNLGVHVIMYYYYYATAGGAKIWWKKYLTTMQIVQFVIDIFVVYFGTYQHFVHVKRPSLPHFGNCAGSEPAALFGCILLTSYLGLFINFYMQTYKKSVVGAKIGNGHANGKRTKAE